MNQKQKESKRDRFIRLASRRTNEVLEKLRILGGCANKRMYDYDDTDVKKIFRAIDEEVKRVKGLFAEGKKKEFVLEG